MILRIRRFSKDRLVKYCFPRTCVVISIYASVAGQTPARLPSSANIRAVLKLDFHEWSRETHDFNSLHDHQGSVRQEDLMTERQAEAILEFVVRHRPYITEIVVSCEGGLCRSQGVERALKRICFRRKLKKLHVSFRHITELLLAVAKRKGMLPL